MRALPPSPIWLLAPFLALTTSEPISLVPRGNESSSPAPATPSSNPNHIFNAIHSSMRQWGSSLNHNGMSAFLATVPEGVQLYHGTSNSEPVEGMEWLAFEPEHALLFARPRGPPPGREPPGHGSGPDDTHGGGPPPGPWMEKGQRKGRGKRLPPPGLEHGPPRRGNKADAWERFNSGPQSHLAGPGPHEHHDRDEEGEEGYLHTYTTAHALRLLYLDGQSAAKSDKGTLDLQDRVLNANSSAAYLSPKEHDGEGRRSGPMGEFERASALCAAAEKEWNGRIDGVLRMEGGFEIILCEFKDHLRVESIKQVEKGSDGGPGGPGGSDDDHFDYYRAVAARYDGIGGGRVRLNYEDMVTAFADPELLEWDAKGFPRITTRNATAVHGFRDRIARMITQGNSSPDSSSDRVDTDWQAVTDLIVSRYADRIEYLTSGSLTDLSALKAEAARALRPFIDFGARDPDRELHRCATQFLSPLRRIPSSPHPPSSPHDAVAYRAVQDVSAAVCAALSSVSTAQSYRDALSTLRELKSNLAWTSWKKCGACGPREVCFVPIWPAGTREDWERPRCKSDVGGGFGRGDGERYWDGPGGPKRSDEKEGR